MIAWFETNLQLLCYFITDLIAVIKAWTRFNFFPFWYIRAVLECLLLTKKAAWGHYQHGRQVNWLALKGLWFRPKRLMFHNVFEIRRAMKTLAVEEFALEKEKLFFSPTPVWDLTQIKASHYVVNVSAFVFWSLCTFPLYWRPWFGSGWSLTSYSTVQNFYFGNAGRHFNISRVWNVIVIDAPLPIFKNMDTVYHALSAFIILSYTVYTTVQKFEVS